MFNISKRFDFSASHQLSGLPDDHPCSRLHGHNYSVEVVLAGDVDATGFVFDYRSLDVLKQFIDANLDHQHLNAVVAYNPTAELLAKDLHALAVKLLEPPDDGRWRVDAVRVSETPKTWAEWRP